MAKHRSTALLVALAASAVIAGCSSKPSGYSTHTHCGGEVCMAVIGSGSTVGDVIGYFAPGGNSVANQTWRLMLSAYDCNPNAHHSTPCNALQTYPGPTRTGNPPPYATCTSKSAATFNGQPTCPTHLAQEMATLGDFQGFPDISSGKPHVFAKTTWLCLTAQLDNNGSWLNDLAPGTDRPSRACSEVSA